MEVCRDRVVQRLRCPACDSGCDYSLAISAAEYEQQREVRRAQVDYKGVYSTDGGLNELEKNVGSAVTSAHELLYPLSAAALEPFVTDARILSASPVRLYVHPRITHAERAVSGIDLTV